MANQEALIEVEDAAAGRVDLGRLFSLSVALIPTVGILMVELNLAKDRGIPASSIEAATGILPLLPILIMMSLINTYFFWRFTQMGHTGMARSVKFIGYAVGGLTAGHFLYAMVLLKAVIFFSFLTAASLFLIVCFACGI